MALETHLGSFGVTFWSFGVTFCALGGSLGPPWGTLGPRPSKNIKKNTFWELILESLFEDVCTFSVHVFQLQFGGTFYDTAFDAPLQTNDRFLGWRLGGKVVAFSPLRGAPLWSAARVTLGKSNDLLNSAQEKFAGRHYVFTEAMATWEANSNLALNLNPKLVISSAGDLWGLGVSSNFQLAPGWQLIAEVNAVVSNLINLDQLSVDRNLVIDNSIQTNGTIGLRWQVNDGLAVEAYGSTAASLLDAAQLLSSNQVRWGTRLIFSF